MRSLSLVKYQPSVTQHAQMLGNRGARDRKIVSELAHGHRFLGESLEYRATRRVSERRQLSFGWGHADGKCAFTVSICLPPKHCQAEARYVKALTRGERGTQQRCLLDSISAYVAQEDVAVNNKRVHDAGWAWCMVVLGIPALAIAARRSLTLNG